MAVLAQLNCLEGAGEATMRNGKIAQLFHGTRRAVDVLFQLSRLRDVACQLIF
jgi:hypothetical protein